MRARRERAVALAALKAADRSDDRASVDQLLRVVRDFERAPTTGTPPETGNRLEAALGFLAGIVVGLLVIWRWLR